MWLKQGRQAHVIEAAQWKKNARTIVTCETMYLSHVPNSPLWYVSLADLVFTRESANNASMETLQWIKPSSLLYLRDNCPFTGHQGDVEIAEGPRHCLSLRRGTIMGGPALLRRIVRSHLRKLRFRLRIVLQGVCLAFPS